MMRIHELISRGQFPNCVQMAGKIEVSSRTIKRDVDFMKYRLELPIEYDVQRHGYCYTRPVEHFPSLPVTEAEVFALLVAHKAIAQYQGTPFQAPLEAAFRKLSGQLNDRHQFTVGGMELSFRPFAPERSDLETFEILSRALQQERALQFSYRNLGGERAQGRRVHPYHVTCFDNRCYLVAHDPARSALRTFSLARMRSLELLPERFTRPKDFKIDEYLKGSFGIFNSDKDFEAVIHFDKWAGQLIQELRWHPTQELTTLPGGEVRLRLRLNNLEELQRWVLSWGGHATVIRPTTLRAGLLQTASALVTRYQADSVGDR